MVGSPMSRRFRVLTCDQDPAVNGAIGHLLGVAFRTPALFDRRTHSVSVEILGDFNVATPLMAPLQSEQFAASAYSRRLFAPKPAVVVTLSGIDNIQRESVVELNAPLVCLSELSMSDPSGEMGVDHFTCSFDHTCFDCVTRELGESINLMRVAELCKRFAMVFARDFGERTR